MDSPLKRNSDSIAAISNAFRLRRISKFLNLLKSSGLYSSDFNILDVGGTVDFWVQMHFLEKKELNITILNLSIAGDTHPNITTIVGNGCNMAQFKDQEFDAVFSNSVIEHVRTIEHQKMMAREIQRVGKFFFLQTPNFYFPVEPHFLFFGFQFLPLNVKVKLLQYFNIGWFNKAKSYNDALDAVTSIRLLKEKELKDMFSKAIIEKETYFGFTKSFMVHNFVSQSI